MPKACIHDNGEDRCVAEEGPHCICRLSAFVLSNGFSLALFVGRVIDANVIIQKNERKNDMKKCKLLLFDLDGTLLQSEKAISTRTLSALKNAGKMIY